MTAAEKEKEQEKDIRREFDYRRKDFEAIRRRLHLSTGINLSDSKEQLVYSRIARRVRAIGLRSFSDYLDYLKDNEQEEEAFVNALTTNLTSFFREPHHFDILADYLRDHHRPGRQFRIWCAAASTGEEPYSLAITALEALGENAPVKIIATDIDSSVLAEASAGVYGIDRVKSLEPERLKAFFLRGTGPNQGKVKVRRELRQMIDFAALNLLAPRWSVQPAFDLIFCRNVMIYFDKPTQKQVLERMVPYLLPEGLYVAGHSESFSNASDLVRLVGKTTYRVVDRVAS